MKGKTGMGRGTPLPWGTVRRHGRILALALLLAGVSWGCASLSSEPSEGSDVGGRLAEGEAALYDGRYAEAYWIFRELASTCEAGEEGREAILLLATAELDPRNPARFPPGAAYLAARYLQVPSLGVTARAAAESVYLLALDLGAPPVEDPYAPIPANPALAMDDRSRIEETRAGDGSAQSWSAAARFRNCSSPASGEEVVRDLPTLSGPSLHTTLEIVLDQRDIARSRVDSLSAELERIRGLLRSEAPTPDSATDRR